MKEDYERKTIIENKAEIKEDQNKSKLNLYE